MHAHLNLLQCFAYLGSSVLPSHGPAVPEGRSVGRLVTTGRCVTSGRMVVPTSLIQNKTKLVFYVRLNNK